MNKASSVQPKKCLVLGANGFIGSHLVDQLAKSGFIVIAFDRYTNLPQFNQNSKVTILKGDIFDDITVSNILRGVDYLIHSFSATTPFTSDTDPYSDISLNVMRNIQLFEKSVEAGIKKVVFISSGGAVYGRTAEEKDCSESAAPNPVSPYGIGKLTTEYYLDYFNRKYGLGYISYRLSNPYGPRQVNKHNQGVIPTFMQKIINNEEITIIGDGTSSRDYIYIADAVEMIVNSFEDAKQEIYNLGSGIQITVNEIITIFDEILNVNKPLKKYVEAPKTFLKRSNLNVARFTQEFGVQANTDFKAGLKKTLEGLTLSNSE